MHVQPDYQDTVTRMYAAMTIRNQQESVAPLQDQMQEAERLADELTLLLTSYQSFLEREGIRDQVEILQYWAESYRNGLNAADRISRNAGPTVAVLQERAKLATQELHRFEDDGGPVASKQQSAEAESMMRRFIKAAPDLENMARYSQMPSAKRHSSYNSF